MHNNGTNRIWLPEDKPVLRSSEPAKGFDINITDAGIVISPYVGDQRLDLLLNAQTATQLGVNLISIAAFFNQAQQQLPKATPPPEVTLD